MKAKLKKQETDSGVQIGSNSWDGTVTINGKSYESGKEYAITKEEFQSGLFEEIKPKKKETKK
jgi:hypothetical protein